MPRIPYAAKVLIKQVKEERSRTKTQDAAEPDGLGVIRTIRFNKQTSKWLAPLLLEIADPRIETLDWTENGLEVTFIRGPKADQMDKFPLLDAATVLHGGHNGVSESTVPEAGEVTDDDVPLPTAELS